MGCWNETDALTQLPILYGDPVKLIVISSTPDGDEELVFPRCFPISGKYNDFGSIKEIEEDWATDAFLAYCNKRFEDNKWAFAEDQSARIKIFGIKYPFTTIEGVLKAIERGFIVSSEWCEPIVPVFFVMIHDEIYAKAVEMGGNSVDYDLSYLETIRGRVGEVFNELDKLIEASAPEEPSFFSVNNLLSGRLFSMLGSINGGYIRDVYGDACFGGTNEKGVLKDNYLSRLIELACLRHFMFITRRKFYKQAGSGSQDSEFELAANFFSFAKEYALKRHNELDDWEEEDSEAE